MDALLVRLHRQRYGEHVLGRQGRVGVALAARVGQVGFADGRLRFRRCHHLVRRAVATLADGRVTIQLGMGAAVNASVVFTHFRGVAGGAELHSARGGLHHVVRSVAGDASGTILGIAQHRMRARAELGRCVVMAGNARSRSRLRRVTTLGRPRVAIDTTEILVNAVCQSGGIDRDGLSLRIHHSRAWTVAGKAILRREEGGGFDRQG